VSAPTSHTYHPDFFEPDERPDVLFGCIPRRLFFDHSALIEVARTGIPGHWLACITDSTGLHEAIGVALGMTVNQLDDACRSEFLDSRTSETVLDLAGVFSRCLSVWESQELAYEWLMHPVTALNGHSPISLLDTFEGRHWIAEVLRKIEGGDFS
jgi:uncharacterized protein (DUF2384 family)